MSHSIWDSSQGEQAIVGSLRFRLLVGLLTGLALAEMFGADCDVVSTAIGRFAEKRIFVPRTGGEPGLQK